MLTNLNHCLEWEEEVLFHNAENFYSDIINSFSNATKSIHIEAHYFDEKTLGLKIIKSLLKALERNIEVYLILDGISPLSRKNSLLRKLLEVRGAHIRTFNPLPWRKLTPRNIYKINQRTHKKLILVDKKIAYVGSYNIDTRQLSYGKGAEGWSDCGVRIKGKELSRIFQGFWDTWNFCKYPHRKIKPLSPQTKSLVRLNHHKFWRRFYLDDIINRINAAKDTIWITNPYFVPDKRMKDSLLQAHLRGVEVIIIIPQKSDLKLFPLINFIFLKSLVLKGIKVYEYLPSILHTKNIIIDNWTIIGSSNLNSRSQKHDWELDIVLTKKSSITELKNRFLKELSLSKIVTSVPAIKKFGVQSLASPLIVGSKYFL